MIKITKNEAKYMKENGYEDCIIHTTGHHKEYRLVEEREDVYAYDKNGKRGRLLTLGALNALKRYREEITIATVE